jgi:hypothetical protein
MNYIVPVISTIILIIGIKKKYNYLILVGMGLNVLVWPNIPHTYTEYIYYVLSSIIATIIGYNVSKFMN